MSKFTEEAPGLPANTLPAYNLVLSGFGLSLLKPKFYRNDAGHEVTVPDKQLDFRDKATLVFGAIQFTDVDGLPFIISSVLMDVSQDKNIVITNIQGREGSVKEYISNGDYNVVLRGAIVQVDGNSYPQTDVERLHAILQLNTSLPIVSGFLNQYNIRNLVVLGFSFPQKEGFNNTQLFEIRAISDDEINVRIKKDGST
jgi:hypothetical protein